MHDTIAASGNTMKNILCIIGPTASGKSARAIEEALLRGSEIISVDSRQVYRGLDIGTEKLSVDERSRIPHHLIDVRDPQESYSAGDFVKDATQLIEGIHSRGKLPILAGGSHFYFDALIHGLPAAVDANPVLREKLEKLSTEELFARIREQDPRRANELDPRNRRRLIRALEITESEGTVPQRETHPAPYNVEWICLDVPVEVLHKKINERLMKALSEGLIEEVAEVRGKVGDTRLNELGLEYKVVGEYLRGERTRESLLPALSSKLKQYARRQKAWLHKLGTTSEESVR
jgi:tRNA dimethylallyltransferase